MRERIIFGMHSGIILQFIHCTLVILLNIIYAGFNYSGDKGVKNISNMLIYNLSLRTLNLRNYYYYLYIIHSEYRE